MHFRCGGICKIALLKSRRCEIMFKISQYLAKSFVSPFSAHGIEVTRLSTQYYNTFNSDILKRLGSKDPKQRIVM